MRDEEKSMRDTADERDNPSGYHDGREGVKYVDCYAAVVNEWKGASWEMMSHARLR